MAIAPPRIRVLIVLGAETGMRTGEMIQLRWDDIDLLGNLLRVEKSKSMAGIRSVPLSAFCKSELLKWRGLVGPEFSEWVFPTFTNRRHPLQGGRKAWASALKRAGIPSLPDLQLAPYLRFAYDGSWSVLDHHCPDARALVNADVPRYAQVLDQNRLEAVKKLEALRQISISNQTAPVKLGHGSENPENPTKLE